uniref:Uncharacterized protein n=2 Tax=Anguilla anguilla TaxID=7936 RepID=A0A0E9QKA9_ANGAN
MFLRADESVVIVRISVGNPEKVSDKQCCIGMSRCMFFSIQKHVQLDLNLVNDWTSRKVSSF